MSPPAIEARGVRKSYRDRPVLDGLDLTVPAGTVLALLGANGAGKTTTVRILTTLLSPDGGTARVGGHDVRTEPAAVRRAIGLTSQQASVDELLTGRENLELFAGLNHLGWRASRRRASELLEQFRLTEAAERRVGDYSGGMRRRLDLAVSMVAAPRILFLDEPTTGLDPRSRVDLWDVVRDLVRAGTTILLTTQYLEEADQLADRVAVIDGGRIVEEDTPDGLKRRVGTERLRLALAQPGHAPAAVALQPGAHLDPETGEIVVPLRDPDHLRQVLDDLHRAGFPVASVSLSAPTLDDVFFRLTEKEPAA
ncbi:daunorubicin resistance protein DrrA family ABC transporter ATP-binding protein [Saccharomonospora glauca]|jgi:ABC-2 type transport system ATP-binding protein|uniref:Daunorubicin resistance ABC transporter ATP-binding subunit n=1 Tax=Saccharomonospora glauca K62 TaxID=928724 RepID=I1CWH8_9PSEU|nr:daunorubicin resistance protein DrrA family ABC transporter ATP-binding protein [Saccharomonospora glauca]EIE97052.1 daunorubicin resistance ABC transporter ATP-binding subunit [Saccharomonospora glauca K62]